MLKGHLVTTERAVDGHSVGLQSANRKDLR